MSNFPTDSDGVPCGYSANEQYPYIFVPDITVPQTVTTVNIQRVCVATCPASTYSDLECKTNSQVPSCSNVNTYPSGPQFQRLGGFCAPNSDSASALLVQNLNLQSKWDFLNTYDIIRISMLIAFGIGFLWMLLVQCIPRATSVLSLVLGCITLIVCGVLLLVDGGAAGWQGLQAWRVVLGVLLMFFGVIFFAMLFAYKRRIKTTGIFLAYSAKFLGDRWVNFLFIPVFIVMLLGLLALCLFQYLAYSSQANPLPVQGDIYLQLTQNIPLTILTIIELIWGSQFLKDSCNFVLTQLISLFRAMRLNGTSKLGAQRTAASPLGGTLSTISGRSWVGRF
jgi:hypothetical protein